MGKSSFWRFFVVALLLTCTPLSTALAQRGGGSDFPGSRMLQRLGRLGQFPNVNERSHKSIVSAFREVGQNARQSTVRVFGNSQPVALGTIVSDDGFVVTKASELRGNLECLTHDGNRYEATIVATDRDYDLALIKMQADGLTPVSWSASPPDLGAWLVTTDIDADPAAIGVVSAEVRQMPPARAVLGVKLEHTEQGPRVFEIVPESAAARAALHVGDVIVRLNGQLVDSPQAVSQTIGGFRPGERIRLALVRGADEMEVIALLGDYAKLGNEQAAIMESLGGPLSARRSGFPVVLQHDSVLRPRECGGPIVDLDGNAVGVNIARASRVSTYAIPSDTVRSLINKLRGERVAGAGAGLQNTVAP